jgi:gas vesicle protein
MAEQDEFGAFLIGFIVGGLTGAAISLLLAPHSGEETRELLKDQAIVLKDKAQETAQTTVEQVNVRTADVRTKASEIAGKAKTSAEDLAHRSQVILEEKKAA